MKKLTQAQYDSLLRYVDGELTAAERQNVEGELSRNELMREELALLQVIGGSLSKSKTETPSRNFTDLVMRRLHEYPGAYSGISVRNGIFLLIGVLVVVAIASIIVASGTFDNTSTTIDVSNYQPAVKFIKKSLPTFSLPGKIVIDAIILLNLALAWVVLDRVILRPIFQRRLNQYSGASE